MTNAQWTVNYLVVFVRLAHYKYVPGKGIQPLFPHPYPQGYPYAQGSELLVIMRIIYLFIDR